MPEIKTLIWVALAAIAPGRASLMSCFTWGVRFGSFQSTFAPDLRTPHIRSAAWDAPATSTPADAHFAAATGSRCGRTKISIIRLSSAGCTAETMKRPRAFSTPDRCAAMAIAGRYGMQICVSRTASLYFAPVKPGLMRCISQGMARSARMVSTRVAAASVAMASAASTSAFSSPSASSALE